MPTPYETPVNGRKQERNVNTGCTALYQFSIAVDLRSPQTMPAKRYNAQFVCQIA
ncbi:MAG: hypothetical protein AAFO04_03770 [Cyanobacteria bacterium J06592_8]